MDDIGKPDFDRTVIDWRFVLSGAHWLILEMSSFEERRCISVGAAMVFAELEGAKTALVVDENSKMDADRAWGSIVERIRQSGSFNVSNGRAKIGSMEKVEDNEVGGF